MEKFALFDWQAEFAPEYGGNLCRLAWHGHDILRPPPSPEALDAQREYFGFPVLFPGGRIRDGRFAYAGRNHVLPITDDLRNAHLHGVALKRAWQMTERGAASRKMTFDYGPDAPEFIGFPCPFRLELEYRFTRDTVEQLLTVENTGSAVLPCCPGFHTEFRAPDRVRIAEAGQWEIEETRKLATGRRIPWSADFRPDQWFAPNARAHSFQFAAPPEPTAEIDWDFGIVVYSCDPKFRSWCIWSPEPDCGFIALEPYAAVGGALNLPDPEKYGVLPLAPGASARYRSTFRIIPKQGGLS